MKFVVALLAIAVVALAQLDPFEPSDYCSYSATGTASLAYGQQTLPFYASMIRVGDQVRYDLYAEEAMTTLTASIISRPDIGHTFFYSPMFSSLGGSCLTKSYQLSRYAYSQVQEEPGLWRAHYTLSDGIYDTYEMVIKQNGDLHKEKITFHIPPSDPSGSPLQVVVSIEYTKVNPDYEHEVDNGEFKLVADTCPIAARQPIPFLTSTACDDYYKEPGICSVKGEGDVTMKMAIGTASHKGSMVRVGPYARYDVYDEVEGNKALVGSLLNRYDQGTLYLSLMDPDTKSMVCMAPPSLDYVRYGYTTSDGFDVFGGISAVADFLMYFKGNDLKKEVITIYTHDYGTIEITISYTNVQEYSYEGEGPNPFVVVEDMPESCSEAKQDISAGMESKTSELCPKHLSPVFSCAQEFVLTSVDNRRRGKRDDPEPDPPRITTNIKLMAADGEIVYFKVESEDEVGYLRCDETKRHMCKSVYSNPKYSRCYNDFSPVDYVIWDYFPTFYYYSDPESIPCPNDAEENCKYYCDDDDICIVVDSQGRYLRVDIVEEDNKFEGIYIYEYKTTEPTLSDFAIDNVCGVTMEAPTDDPCVNDPSSSSTGGGGGGDDSSATSGGGDDSSATSGGGGEEAESFGTHSLPSLIVVVAALVLLL